MGTYGQYCPLAYALEIVGDRWTLLIIRDMMLGTRRFNDLERGLPGISRALLSKRLRQLQAHGLVEKRVNQAGRQSTEYCLTAAGDALYDALEALVVWGAKWAFGDPRPEDLDPLLLMWWMHKRVNADQLPDERVVVQFNFHGPQQDTFWLVMTCADTTLCLIDPGYEINLLVRAELATFFKLYAGRISYHEAVDSDAVQIDGAPRLIRAFPSWFQWSAAAAVVYDARA
jgi:DNA-binding HxlR family transcriptional regulator